MFSFIDDISPASLSQSANDLGHYLARAAEWDGKVSTAEPLLMVFNPAHVKADSVAGYHAMGWDVLQYWHDNDPKPWPGNVSLDPHTSYWSMCFSGVQIFVNMSNPAHVVRKSRNLGHAMTFVINPRERFDMVAGDNPQGRKIREMVRERIEIYDSLPHSPALGSYEAGEIEWWQYGLTETNEPRLDRCPFHSKPQADDRTSLAADSDEPIPYNVMPRRAAG